MTRLLLTRIPFFREVILMSFSCERCGFKNSEVQSAGQIQELGCRYFFTPTEPSDLQRQIVKSDTCDVKIDDLGLEVPAGRGRLTSIEGLLTGLLEGLDSHRRTSKSIPPEAQANIEATSQKARDVLAFKTFSFTLELDDPAGNSWIEPSVHDGDKKLVRSQYKRTPHQNQTLGLADTTLGTDGEVALEEGLSAHRTRQRDVAQAGTPDELVPDEVCTFHAACPGCGRPCSTNMKMVEIPHFQEVVLMSTVCEHCGCTYHPLPTFNGRPKRAHAARQTEVTRSRREAPSHSKVAGSL